MSVFVGGHEGWSRGINVITFSDSLWLTIVEIECPLSDILYKGNHLTTDLSKFLMLKYIIFCWHTCISQKCYNNIARGLG